AEPGRPCRCRSPSRPRSSTSSAPRNSHTSQVVSRKSGSGATDDLRLETVTLPRLHSSRFDRSRFFYGTLMSGFERAGRARVDAKLTPQGRGWIAATLFDLGLYPPAIPPAHRLACRPSNPITY